MFKKTLMILFITLTSFQKTQSYCPTKLDSLKKADVREFPDNNDEQTIRQITQKLVERDEVENIPSESKACADQPPQHGMAHAILLVGCTFSALYAHFCIL